MLGPFHLDDLIGLGVQVGGGWAYSGLESMRARSYPSLSQGEKALPEMRRPVELGPAAC